MTGKIKAPAGGEGGCFYLPARYVVGAMCFMGITLQYTIKVLLSVAIVAMVKTESQHSNDSQLYSDILRVTEDDEDLDVCPGRDSSTSSESQGGEFEWDDKMQGYTISSYYYGYVATQLLAGRLGELFGSKAILGPGVFFAGLATVLSPFAARLDVGVFIAARVIAGAASGLIIPSMHNVLAKWFVPEERSFMGGLMITGIPVGTVIAMTLSGVLAESGGWPLIFYFFGGISLAFIAPWTFLVYNTPDEHPRISEKERNFILKGNAFSEEDKVSHGLPVPWLSILFSLPMWAHNAMAIGYAWVSFTLLSELPTYLSKMLHFNLQQSGLISALPYISLGLSSVLGGYISQWLRLRGYLSRLAAYNIFNSLSGFGSGLSLLLITFVGCNSTVIIILLVLSMALSGLYQGGGSFINHVDLGKNFTGTLAGFYLSVMNSMGIFAPILVGLIIDGEQTLSQWKIVFYVAAAVPSVGSVLYLLYGSVEEQSWNKIPEKPKMVETSKQMELV